MAFAGFVASCVELRVCACALEDIKGIQLCVSYVSLLTEYFGSEVLGYNILATRMGSFCDLLLFRRICYTG